MNSILYIWLIIQYLLPVVLSNGECIQQNSYVLNDNLLNHCESERSVSIRYKDINIDANVFRNCSQLEQLRITQTNLSSVSDDLFQNIRQLKDLDLSDNLLKEVGILNLTLNRFNISRNNLDVKYYSFINMRSLRVLDLSKNIIFKLDENIFRYNIELEELYLSANNIDALPDKLFKKLCNLWKLSLNKNRIKVIGQRVFSNMISISILDLAYNLITVLEAGTFDSNTNLTELYLNDNKITMLPDGLFKKLKNLTKIHLQRNQLTYIGSGVFPETATLIEMFLHRNQLKYFDATALKLDGLKSIKLYDNIWVCDCQLKALFEFSKNKLLDQATKCSMPDELSGKHWIYLTAEDFKCNHETGNVCMHVRERTIYSYNNNVSHEFCQEENETVIGDFVSSNGHRYTLIFDTGKDDSPSHLTLEYTDENQSKSQCMNSVWTAIVAVTLALLLTEIFILIFINLKHKTTKYSNEIPHRTEENAHVYAKPGKSMYHPNGMLQKMMADNGHIYAEPDVSIKLPNGTGQKTMEDNGHIYAEPDYAAASRYKHGSK